MTLGRRSGELAELLSIDYTAAMDLKRVGIWMALALCVGTRDLLAQHVSIDIHDSGVTLVARDVPLERILTEWSRIGGVEVVIRGEGLPAAPITLLLRDLTERAALDILLRDAAGYLLLGRAADATGRSSFGRIIVVPNRAPSSTNTEQTLDVSGETRTPRPTVTRRRVPALAAAPPSDVQAADVQPADQAGDPDDQAIRRPDPPRPPTPLLPPPRQPADPANPFGAVGTDRPGVIVPPSTPPPGVWYPPVTNPNARDASPK